MKGTIRQRGTSYTWQFSAMVLKDGQRVRRHFTGTAKTKRDAATAMRAAMAPYDRSEEPVLPSKEFVVDYLTTWLAQLPASGLKPSTISTYGWQIKKWVIPNLGHLRLADLSAKAIRTWEAKLATSGGRDGRPLGRASVQGARRALSSALEDAVADGVLGANPVKAAASRKRGRSGTEGLVKVDPWRPEEARAFLAATSGTRWHAVWHLALHTGLRRGELLGLEWGDLDLDRFRLTVARNRVDAGEAGIVEGTAKSGKGRTLSLDPETVAVLRKWRTWQEADATLAGEGWTETGKVFTHEDGRAFDPISLRWAFQVALREWGGRRIRFHDTRHTHAAMLISASIHPKVIQDRLGHAHIQTTLGIYGHLFPESDVDAAKKAAALLSGL